MPEVNFLQSLHTSTKRDYYARMNPEKPECMRIAKQYGFDYWDGERKYGYGGYKYDGRWAIVARAMIMHYGLKSKDSILDIGCGKGFLLHELNELIPDAACFGIDISRYALQQIIPPPYLTSVDDCRHMLFLDRSACDLTYSINVFHNLGYKDLKLALKEMNRVTKPNGQQYICVESYRNEEELCNLQCWALTCQSFYTPDDWLQIYEDCGYKGDYEFIFFP